MPVYATVANILMKEDLRSEEEDLLGVSSHVSDTVISWMVVGLAPHLEKQISLKERDCITFRATRQGVEQVHLFARVLEDIKGSCRCRTLGCHQCKAKLGLQD